MTPTEPTLDPGARPGVSEVNPSAETTNTPEMPAPVAEAAAEILVDREEFEALQRDLD